MRIISFFTSRITEIKTSPYFFVLTFILSSSLLLFFILFPLPSSAQSYCEGNEYCRVNVGEEIEVDTCSWCPADPGCCRVVMNDASFSDAADTFVPIKTCTEWAEFKTHRPAHIWLSACLGNVCHDESGVPMTTNWGANLYGCEGYNKRCFEGDCKTCEDDIIPTRNITKALIYSDGCSGYAGQGGNACWRLAQQGDGVTYGATDYSCDILCANYGGCVAANWNESLDCGMTDGLTGFLGDCISQCEWAKSVGRLPPTTDCHARCCKEGNWDNWGTNAPKLPATGFSFFPPNGVYYRAGYINQDCGGVFVSNKRFCVCQY